MKLSGREYLAESKNSASNRVGDRGWRTQADILTANCIVPGGPLFAALPFFEAPFNPLSSISNPQMNYSTMNSITTTVPRAVSSA